MRQNIGPINILLYADCLRQHLHELRRISADPRFLSHATPSRFSSNAQPEEQDASEEHAKIGSDRVTHLQDAREHTIANRGGAMTQRLRDLSESESIRGQDVEAAGFDSGLKEQLLQRIHDANSPRRINQQAFSVTEMPASAGKQALDIASAQPWSGTESIADASLRMLNDAHKPMRVPKAATPARIPQRIDTGRPQKAGSVAQGARLANARDKTSAYAYLKDPSLSDEERQKFREQLKHRFGSTARTVPATIKGLTSLANERIEDAIARGQFKNIKRGKDANPPPPTSSSYIDTTSALLNRHMKSQDVVPPWIERQGELIAAATRFRARLRSEWRRHAARTIAAEGGTLESQITRAEEYAVAEMAVNPPRRKQQAVNTVAEQALSSQISLSGELRIPPEQEQTPGLERQIEKPVGMTTDNKILPEDAPPKSPTDGTGNSDQPIADPSAASPPPPPRPVRPPFRDPAWLEMESGYHNAAIKELNSICRSYNLMAPELAKRPYYSLNRELQACFADVAPTLAAEIQERALGPRAHLSDARGNTGRGLIDNLTGNSGHVGTIRDEGNEKQYGLKQFWRDVFGAK